MAYIGFPCFVRFIGENCSDEPIPPIPPVPGPLDFISDGTGLSTITATFDLATRSALFGITFRYQGELTTVTATHGGEPLTLVRLDKREAQTTATAFFIGNGLTIESANLVMTPVGGATVGPAIGRINDDFGADVEGIASVWSDGATGFANSTSVLTLDSNADLGIRAAWGSSNSPTYGKAQPTTDFSDVFWNRVIGGNMTPITDWTIGANWSESGGVFTHTGNNFDSMGKYITFTPAGPIGSKMDVSIPAGANIMVTFYAGQKLTQRKIDGPFDGIIYPEVISGINEYTLITFSARGEVVLRGFSYIQNPVQLTGTLSKSIAGALIGDTVNYAGFQSSGYSTTAIGLKNKLFNVLDIPSLAVWLDLSKPSSVAQIVGSVSQVNDLSGNGNHATQATGTNQPLYGGSFVNGLNTLKFDGVNDFMNVASGIFNIANGPNTLLYAFKLNTVRNSRPVVGGLGSTAQRFGAWIDAGAKSCNFYQGSGSPVGTGNDTVNFDTNVHYILQTSDGLQYYGSYDGTVNTAIATHVNQVLTKFTLGVNPPNNDWFAGELLEVVGTYNKMTEGWLSQLKNYIKNKWNPPLNPLEFISTVNYASDSMPQLGAYTNVVVHEPFYIGESSRTIVPSFYNFTQTATTDGGVGNAYTVVSAAIYRDGYSDIYPVTFAGLRSKVIPNDASDVQADVINVNTIKGQKWWRKMVLSIPTANLRMPMIYAGVDSAVGVTGKQFHRYNPVDTTVSTTDATGVFTSTGVALNNGFNFLWFGGMHILGNPVVAGRSRMFIGDSICAGLEDSSPSTLPHGKGFLQRGSNIGTDLTPCHNIGIPSIQTATINARTRWLRYAKYCRVAAVMTSTNDNQQNATLEQLKSRITTLCNTLKSNGLNKIVMSKLITVTTSTDSYVTAANQTPAVNWQYPGKTYDYNNWLETQVGSLFSGLITLDALRDVSAPNIWKGQTPSLTLDGIHPYSVGYSAVELEAKTVMDEVFNS